MVLKQVADMGLNTAAAKLLEVGCGPGGNTLAFAKHFPFGTVIMK
jgi:ubiquinone/menaquinone biosynthesis C-methylase UbiE